MGMFLPDTSVVAQSVLMERYLLKDLDGEVIETEEEMYSRVANFVGQDESEDIRNEFFEMMKSKVFLPNTPCLINAGISSRMPQLMACIVLPVDDSLDSIMHAVTSAAKLHASGGGTGFSFSRLRPTGDIVSSTHGKTSGPVPFMKMFNDVTNVIQQGGSRRGANIGVMRVDHPDIMDFIHCKRDGDFPNFNISVGITDAFMDALDKNEMFSLVNPRNNDVVDILPAKEIWDALVQNAWECGDPGVVFLDTINKADVTPELGPIEATNPCGEIPLHSYETCVLGHINLSKFDLTRPNWDDLARVIDLGVRFLDDMVEHSEFPVPEVAEACKRTRRIGLGVMGWADVLIQHDMVYGSEESLEFAEDVMRLIKKEALYASKRLGNERGVPDILKGKDFPPRRNATFLTIAPTGTTSIIAGCSSGIEPIYALAYERRILDGTVFNEVHPLFDKYLDGIGIDRDVFLDKLKENEGRLSGIDLPPQLELVRDKFVTALELDYKVHIDMQAVFQKYVDSSVSKTVNMFNSCTSSNVNDAYLRAYRSGCKGVTVYRDRCKEAQVFTGGSTVKKEQSSAYTREQCLRGSTSRVDVGCGRLFVTLNHDDEGNPRECFLTLGKAGGCANAQTEAIGRLITLALKYNVPVENIIKQLRGISCHIPAWGSEGSRVYSCADGVAKMLATVTSNYDSVPSKINSLGACPQCGGIMEDDGGCLHCTSCKFKSCA